MAHSPRLPREGGDCSAVLTSSLRARWVRDKIPHGTHPGPQPDGDDAASTVLLPRSDLARDAGTAISGVVRGPQHAGCAGRHGVGQPAPGGRRAPRPSRGRLGRRVPK